MHRDLGVRFPLRPLVFEIQGCQNRKSTEWPYKHLTVKRTLYTLNTHRRDQNFNPFRSTRSRFRDIRFSKCTEWPQNALNHVTAKSSLLHWMFIPQAQISLHFALRPSIFEIQACWKSQMHWMTQNDPKHLTVTNTMYTLKFHSRGPFFTSFHSAFSHFRDTRLRKSEVHRMTREWR